MAPSPGGGAESRCSPPTLPTPTDPSPRSSCLYLSPPTLLRQPLPLPLATAAGARSRLSPSHARHGKQGKQGPSAAPSPVLQPPQHRHPAAWQQPKQQHLPCRSYSTGSSSCSRVTSGQRSAGSDYCFNVLKISKSRDGSRQIRLQEGTKLLTLGFDGARDCRTEVTKLRLHTLHASFCPPSLPSCLPPCRWGYRTEGG